MFYSLAVKMPPHFGFDPSDKTVKDRLLNFDSVLRTYYAGNAGSGLRPHLLYGSHEMATQRDPILLPGLTVSSLDRYDPTSPAILEREDTHTHEEVRQLTEALKPLLGHVSRGYQGDLDSEGRMHGRGTFFFPNGHIYRGEWRAGLRHGHGTYHFRCSSSSSLSLAMAEAPSPSPSPSPSIGIEHENANGRLNDSVYEGEWREGLMSGRGRLVLGAVEMEYSGEWAAGRPHGRGQQVFRRSGDEYSGEWRHGLMHGHGQFKYSSSGAMYSGSFRRDRFEGEGTYIHGTGESYQGQWKDGMMHGKGTFKYRNGTTFEGLWLFDKRVTI
jgi:hypothetical protein